MNLVLISHSGLVTIVPVAPAVMAATICSQMTGSDGRDQNQAGQRHELIFPYSAIQGQSPSASARLSPRVHLRHARSTRLYRQGQVGELDELWK